MDNMQSRCEALREEALQSAHEAEQAKQACALMNDDMERMQMRLHETAQIEHELDNERRARQLTLKKYESLKTRAESVAASLRRSEQQRVRLATKYASVGAKVESLVRAEEDLSAQTQARLSNELDAVKRKLREKEKTHAEEMKRMKRIGSESQRECEELRLQLRSAEQRATRHELDANEARTLSNTENVSLRNELGLLKKRNSELEAREECSERAERERQKQQREQREELERQREQHIHLQVQSKTQQQLQKLHAHYQALMNERLQQTINDEKKNTQKLLEAERQRWELQSEQHLQQAQHEHAIEADKRIEETLLHHRKQMEMEIEAERQRSEAELMRVLEEQRLEHANTLRELHQQLQDERLARAEDRKKLQEDMHLAIRKHEEQLKRDQSVVLEKLRRKHRKELKQALNDDVSSISSVLFLSRVNNT
jgi:hypothetical protein